MNDKIIGIIGGMGPEATAFYYMKLIRATAAQRDQEHFRVIIDGNSKIPDRTKAILYGGESPLAEIGKCIETLNRAKADLAFIPCFTSHYFMKQIREKADFFIIDALQELGESLRESGKEIRRIGILATSGTKKTGLYGKYLEEYELIYPQEYDQEHKVMAAIYSEDFGIKAGHREGRALELLTEAAEELAFRGAEILIAGCTEIGMVMDRLLLPLPILDPMDCAIEAIVSGKYR